MQFYPKSLVILSSIFMLSLAACSNTVEATNPAANVSANPTNSATETTAKTGDNHGHDHAKASKGGQVVETGKYHIEFVPIKEENGTHLDLYLLTGDSHEPVSDAKVKAQVQLPSGEQKTLNFSYKAKDKHYGVLLPEKAVGEYKVVILSEVGGEKVNSRFSFKR
ncbi:hypothetical protein ACE1B6_19455 [Aerosakkonemataceae cyanobacterium BLCC-F154]|uniref:YtkA-like domain-containing protein n=1 Tax=Floridaenema fluviatile BLCC-F154 TaxID=3153640 RepID=A0ABV4YF25_9CYAN